VSLVRVSVCKAVSDRLCELQVRSFKALNFKDQSLNIIISGDEGRLLYPRRHRPHRRHAVEGRKLVYRRRHRGKRLCQGHRIR